MMSNLYLVVLYLKFINFNFLTEIDDEERRVDAGDDKAHGILNF